MVLAKLSIQLCAEHRLIDSKSRSVAPTIARSLPQVPQASDTDTPLDRPRPNLPSSAAARSSIEDTGIYEDIRSSVFADAGGRGDRTSTVDDPYHYIDIDRLANQSGSGNQIVSPQGYEGLDQAVLPSLRQPQRPNSYDRLAAQEAADAGAATEVIEMTALDADDRSQNTVSQTFRYSLKLTKHLRMCITFWYLHFHYAHDARARNQRRKLVPENWYHKPARKYMSKMISGKMSWKLSDSLYIE